VVIFICQRTINVVTKPLTKFADSADEIANGNFEADLPFIKTKDEMRRLYDSFETMQHSLVSQIEETMKVNAQKGRIESELHIASGIQQTMIPKTFPAYPERDDMDIFALLTPAKEVGGDLYDFYIRDEKLFFCIGDVSGKGVPASLVMAVIRSLFRSVTAHESNATRIMTLINEGMSDMNESGMFVTLFVGVLDLPTGRLRYCNAGHCPPIIIGAEVMPLPTISNIPCGIMQSFKFQGQETMMIPGDTLFLYTDGLTEAENLHHELFGDKRPLEVAGKTDALPYNIITAMADAVHAFAGNAEQSDDLTMLAIQYKRIQQEARLKRSLTLPNDISSIPQLNAFIEEAAEEMGLDPSVTMELNLAIEEAVVNVMDYAYPAGKKGTVEIGLSANEERLKITIKDSGVPFDPTVKDDVDTTLSAEERPIGGLGIFLVRQLMDSINYERINGQNILTLCKKLGEKK
jgi:sigma-B regulation protein RsbU (phosphoserine phosphatase)